MGLLDEVLGSLTGQAMGNDPRRQPSQPSPDSLGASVDDLARRLGQR